VNVPGVTGGATAPTSGAVESAKQAKQVGLAFEQMLVNQLAQQMASTASADGSSPDGSSPDGSSPDGSSSNGASGLMGSDPASSAYAQMIPSVLTSSIMSAGGTGIAQQVAQSIDPALVTDPSLGGTPALNSSLSVDSLMGAGGSLGGSL
jgi:Rod binding domain-containing protein